MLKLLQYITVFIFLFPCMTQAQIVERLMADKDVVWMIEYQQEYFFTNSKYDSNNKANRHFPISKIDKEHKTNQLLSSKISTHSKAIKFLDLKTEKPLDIYDDIMVPFSVVDSIKSRKDDKIVMEAVSHTPFEFIESFKVKQLIYFRKSTRSLETHILEVIPVRWTYHNKKFERVDLFKMTNYKTKNTSGPESDFGFSYDYIDLEKGKLLKGNMQKFLKKEFWKKPMKGITPVYRTIQKFDGNQLTKSDLKEIKANKTDTTAIFNPETYEEMVFIITRKKMSIDAIEEYMLIQKWWFDPQDGVIRAEIEELGPMLLYFDTEPFRKLGAIYFLRY